MSTEDPSAEIDAHERAPSPDIPEPSDMVVPDSPTTTTNPRKRPRLELDNGGTRERKKGKSMFGILLGTLNKAKSEDKERSASEAFKKRQLLEQRLANKLKSESDNVRKAESSKKQKSQATRMEEDLCVKDSIYKLRHKRMPLLSGFLCTSDRIPEDVDLDEDAAENVDIEKVLVNPPRSHPPPLYYLPAVLLPRQEKWLQKRQELVKAATEKEHELFMAERTKGVEEIQRLRKEAEAEAAAAAAAAAARGSPSRDMDMDDKESKKKNEEDVDMDDPRDAGKDDDAVEY